MPGTGFLTVGAASALAFCQVLREEYPEMSCKLNQVPPTQGSALQDALKHPFQYRCTVAPIMLLYIYIYNVPINLCNTLILDGSYCIRSSIFDVSPSPSHSPSSGLGEDQRRRGLPRAHGPRLPESPGRG